MFRLDEPHGTELSASSGADPWTALPATVSGGNQPLPTWACTLAPLLPKTTAAMLELDRTQRTSSPLPPRLRARMRWVAANANRSRYGMAYAEADLLQSGATSFDLARLRTNSEDWPPEDRPALSFARRLTVEAYKLLDEDLLKLRTIYGDANVVAMVQLIAYANFQDRLLHALGAAVEPGGALPTPTVEFSRPLSGGAAPKPRESPVSCGEGNAASAPSNSQEWASLDFATLQRLMESQRAREPRIPVPSFESVRQKAPNAFPPGHELRIKWSLVCLGYQPELAQAWTLCTRTFAEEAKQDRVFEESLFWVITRSLQCFY
jgi:alkylhydroperoxidase family enzyme